MKITAVIVAVRVLAIAAVLAACAAPAGAQTPIPQGPGAGSLPAFTGEVATPRPVAAADPPRHPHMAPNGRSNLHADAYQTDTNQFAGPLGRGGLEVRSSFYAIVCGSVTFDTRDRIVTVCVGLLGPTLKVLEARTLRELASMRLPPRDPSTGNPFTSFGGGGYFYLDDRDRAVIPTTSRHLMIVAVTGDEPRLAVVADHDLTGHVPYGDSIISALPDWAGRIWFASRDGVVGTVDPAGGAVRSLDLGEPIGNSFAVDSDGSVSIVSDAALYRFEAAPDGTPTAVWREVYENTGTTKPGQTQAGSGTTPTLMGDDLVAITDNADPMNVVIYQRGRTAEGERLVCRQPVFAPGASATDQSLIATPASVVVENNFGYASPLSTESGRTTAPGLARVDLDDDRRGCRLAWTSDEVAPSVVPKLSLATGLVYTYTKEARDDGQDPWWLTALDFATGRTVYKALAGEGLGFNNNYAPVTLGPDGAAYVGTLGGIVRLADREASPAPGARSKAAPARRRARLSLSCSRRRTVVARVRARGVRRVTFRVDGRTLRRDTRRPFTASVRAGARRITARLDTASGRRTITRRLPACRR